MAWRAARRAAAVHATPGRRCPPRFESQIAKTHVNQEEDAEFNQYRIDENIRKNILQICAVFSFSR
jgi:hypothetical protein